MNSDGEMGTEDWHQLTLGALTDIDTGRVIDQ
jgi:hypothetical protein